MAPIKRFAHCSSADLKQMFMVRDVDTEWTSDVSTLLETTGDNEKASKKDLSAAV